MKIIIVDEKHGGTRSLAFGGWARLTLTLCFFGIPAILGYYAYQFTSARANELDSDKAVQAWAERLESQEAEIRRAREDATAQLQALTLRMANLQARLMRIDALGERLTAVAGLDDGEFDFSQAPAVGGPESYEAEPGEGPDFLGALDELARQIEDRHQQLELLDSLLAGRKTQAEAFLTGWPVARGWISSPFGRRIDPFSGKLAWHEGVDFATGKVGAEVQAVASGVVTFVGERQGYGLLVEVNHGNGYETLYAHDQKVLVKPGDIVKKGQVIALSGSSGRSTGPHVHFEVHKNGRVVDPASYIHRTSR